MEVNELFKRVRKLEIKAKGLTRHIFSGEYHSAFKGRGMAFSEVRNYQLGDEVRTIDWNVTARYNTPFVKVFEEERELSVMLLIDVSGSTNFGSANRTKLETSIELAAILIFSAISNKDKVGAILFSEGIERYIPPGKGRQHGLRILRELIEIKPQSKTTNLIEPLRFLRNTQKKRTTTFLISDFITDEVLQESLRITSKRHDLIAIQLHDEAEGILPSLGFLSVYNAETGETTWLNSNSKTIKKQYQEVHQKQIEQTKNSLKKIGVDHIHISTADDLVKPLIQLFQLRK